MFGLINSMNIVWQVLCKYYTSMVKHPFGILSGKYYGPILRSVLQGWVWIKMCITCEPITYFMLNRMERITDDRITCGILYVYIKGFIRNTVVSNTSLSI